MIYLRKHDPITKLNIFSKREQQLKDKILNRIMSRVEHDPDTHCIIYVGSWNQKGQAVMRVGWRTYTLTKIICWINRPGLLLHGRRVILRTCKSPACVNYDHMVVVPSMKEAYKILNPCKNHKKTLDHLAADAISEEVVDLVTKYYKAGLSPKSLSSLFNIDLKKIQAIIGSKKNV